MVCPGLKVEKEGICPGIAAKQAEVPKATAPKAAAPNMPVEFPQHSTNAVSQAVEQFLRGFRLGVNRGHLN